MNNKLFCTFCQLDQLDNNINTLTNKYNILYNKIFVLRTDNSEYAITYNIDNYNMSGNLIEGTISVHRKKEFNVLYTINALNALIKVLNENKIDPNFKVNWEDYKNSILLTQNNTFKQQKTQLFKVISL